MNAMIVKKALEAYALNCNVNELEEVMRGISEVTSTLEAQKRTYGHADEVSIVDYGAQLGMLNTLLYDVYGKGFKKNGVYFTLATFIIESCKVYPDLESLSAATFEEAFLFLGDLWHDNEEYGANNPDGSFRK